ncbi:MAG TPA: class I SAM-dependent methyltransferase, partial [bacterium]|nr:class I SAM-dependent methyltransferase [bacterium]
DDGPVDAPLITARLTAALNRRAVQPAWPVLTARRLCFSEGDRLPGLIIDQYDTAAAVQYLCPGMVRFRAAVTDWLTTRAGVQLVVERGNRGAGRDKGAAQPGVLVHGAGDGSVTVTEHGVRFAVDLINGQKTGFYANQRDNHALVRGLAQGRRMLDLFCYTGGFALAAAAGGATAVTAVDSSAPAIAQAQRNAALNGVAIDARRQNVFAFLQEPGDRYDLIVVDPPAPASHKDAVPGARQYFLKLMTGALQRLAPNGLLLACSCSHHFGESEIREALRRAAAPLGLELHVSGSYGQPFDHPVAAALPEGDYLRALLVQRGTD